MNLKIDREELSDSDLMKNHTIGHIEMMAVSASNSRRIVRFIGVSEKGQSIDFITFEVESN